MINTTDRQLLYVAKIKNKRLEAQLRLCVAEAQDRLEENEKLKKEVNKIYSRFEIIDL